MPEGFNWFKKKRSEQELMSETLRNAQEQVRNLIDSNLQTGRGIDRAEKTFFTPYEFSPKSETGEALLTEDEVIESLGVGPNIKIEEAPGKEFNEGVLSRGLWHTLVPNLYFVKDSGGFSGFEIRLNAEELGTSTKEKESLSDWSKRAWEQPEADKRADEELTDKFGSVEMQKIFDELGLDRDRINPNILRKLILLNKRTETFKDEERAIHVARALFKYYESNLPDKKFTEQEQRTVFIGTMFTDIGKTGPKDATSEQEEAILDIYEIENIKVGGKDEPKEITLAELASAYFPDDFENKLTVIESINGINRNMTMREFYNLHPQWTLEIISGDGVPPEAVAAAAAHHAVEGVNPEDIIGKDGRFTRYFGDNVSFSRDDKLVVILDKYDAARRRGQMPHQKAVEFVRSKIKGNEKFAEDKEFEELLSSLDAMLSANEEVYESNLQ